LVNTPSEREKKGRETREWEMQEVGRENGKDMGKNRDVCAGLPEAASICARVEYQNVRNSEGGRHVRGEPC